MLKKLIRHATCRRRTSSTQVYAHRSANGRQLWIQTFKKGYIEQSFKRACVRAELLHGEANAPYLQRADHRLLDKGRVSEAKAKGRDEQPVPSICEACEAPTVLSQEAMLAVWS